MLKETLIVPILLGAGIAGGGFTPGAGGIGDPGTVRRKPDAHGGAGMVRRVGLLRSRGLYEAGIATRR